MRRSVENIKKSCIKKSTAVALCAIALVGCGESRQEITEETTNRGLSVSAKDTLRVNVPQATGGKTVTGYLAVTNVVGNRPGHITAFGCDDGQPLDEQGRVTRSNLNYQGDTSSSRLIVKADNDGEVCFFTSQAVDLLFEINNVWDK